ncbi:putative Cytochrome P450 3A24 [Hypsibius exemplaris]|uniref:Cytochrome P450 3A24 n=1 Tax=Hypsibius exemplaris TaxID=2072580 RepID=A0A9X6NKA1_HYPEX|nr:putative Cytochrome P450 3A24 [Hypsibius exemplaris]
MVRPSVSAAYFSNYTQITRNYEGTKPGLIVADPVLLKDIMVKYSATFYNHRSVKTTHPVMSNFLSSLEDSPWKRVRGLVRKTFKPRELKSVHHLLQDSCLALIASLDHAAATGSDIDLKNLFGAYTMEVISRSCFATVPDEEFVKNPSSLFHVQDRDFSFVLG